MQDTQWTGALAELRTIAEETGEMCAAAAAKTSDPDVSQQLLRHRTQHEAQIGRIDRVLAARGAAAPAVPGELTARLADLERRVATSADDEQALRSLLDAELLQAQRYDQALREGATSVAGPLLEEGLAEERAHIDWLQPRAHLAEATGSSASCGWAPAGR